MTNEPLTLGVVAAALLMVASAEAHATSWAPTFPNSALRAALTAQARLGAASVPASAPEISNLGPGNTYEGALGYGIARSGGFIDEIAAGFTPSATFTPTQIQVGITHLSGANSAMLSLEGSAPCQHLFAPPGSTCPDDRPLATFALTGLPQFGSTDVIKPAQIVGVTEPVRLIEGTEYWIVAGPTNASTNSTMRWNLNNVGQSGSGASNVGFGWLPFFGSDATPAFAVAPEPATLGLMVLGLLGAGFAGRRRRN